MNFTARIAAAAARWPDRTAVETVRATGLEAVTYATLLDEAGRVAGWLTAGGFDAGDRAAILADNDARWIAAYLGILWMGGIAVPLDTNYAPAQIRTVAASSGARLLFTTPRYLARAQAAAAGLGEAAPRLALLSGAAAGVTGFHAIRETRHAPEIVDAAAGDPAVILYTSGTTADPKGVVLTHANLEAERFAAFQVVEVTADDVILGVLPLFHSLAQMANLLLPLSVGSRVVFLETISSTSLVEALASRGVSIFACVPQFFYLIHQRVTTEVARRGLLARAVFRLLLAANGWLRARLGWNPGRRWFARVHRVLGPRMRLLVTGGSKFDPAIGRDLYGLGFPLLNAYGLTETSGGATIVRPGDRFTTSVGQPLPGVEIRIAPRDSADAETADGEILIRGPIVMQGYFERPDATAEALRDGWLHTGDLGRLDGEGRLYITGRSKEIIVLSSGKNLYPEEIEAHYRQSPYIRELCVLGLARPDQPAAERLHAVVVPDEDALRRRGIVNVRELVRFELEGLSVSLPAHKRILTYDVQLDPLPRTTTGKLRRPEIERRVLAGAAAGAAAAEDRPLAGADRAWLDEPAHDGAVAAIGAHLGRSDVRPDANLELDLGLDSMERVELLTVLERRHAARVDADTRARIFTVRQMVDAVLAAGTAGGAASGAGDAAELPWDAVLAEPPDPALAGHLRRPGAAGALAFFLIVRALRLVARVLLRFRVRGVEHVPARGAYLLCPNHQSYIDGFFVAAALPYRALRDLFFVGAAEYFQSPFMAWFARAIHLVPVDPDANLVRAMKAGAAGLRQGKVLMLFPEGERSIDGTLKKFRKGAAILASHLDAPVVPVAMDGLFDLWPRGRPLNWRRLLPWRVVPVVVEFAPPLAVPRGQYAEGTAAIRRAVAGLFEPMRAQTRAPGGPA